MLAHITIFRAPAPPVYTTPVTTILGSTWYHCVITQNGSPCDPLVSSPAKCDVRACCPVTFSEKNVNVCKNSTTSRSMCWPMVIIHRKVCHCMLTRHLLKIPRMERFSWLSGSTFLYTPTPGYSGNDLAIIAVCDNATPVPCCTNDTIFYNVVQAITAYAGDNQLLCKSIYDFSLPGIGHRLAVQAPGNLFQAQAGDAFSGKLTGCDRCRIVSQQHPLCIQVCDQYNLCRSNLQGFCADDRNQLPLSERFRCRQ